MPSKVSYNYNRIVRLTMEGEEEPPHTSPSTMSMPYGSANGRIV